MLKLERFAYSPVGTFGTLWLPENEILYTVERPWLDNQKRISCIPEGNYICLPRKYYRGGYDAIHITNVPYRSYILFHRANTMHNVEGCIGVGTQLGAIHNLWAVLNSRNGFDLLMAWAREEFHKHGKFQLHITSGGGPQ